MKVYAFVWHWQDDLLAKARACGLDGVIVKAGDGLSVWPQFAEALPKVKQAGLECWAWTYSYGYDPVGEARVLLHAQHAGADGVVADMEVEYEGKPASCAVFGRVLTEGVSRPTPIGVTTMSSPRAFPTIPWHVMASWANLLMPQEYAWAYPGGSPAEELGVLKDTSPVPFSRLAPVIPLYGRATLQQNLLAVSLLKQWGSPAVLLWSLDTAAADAVQPLVQLAWSNEEEERAMQEIRAAQESLSRRNVAEALAALKKAEQYLEGKIV